MLMMQEITHSKDAQSNTEESPFRGGGGGTLGSIFAGYVQLVYSVAN